jgi:nucleotide-binding universal stress UspA family protein
VEGLRMSEIKKILLPIDFSEASTKILQYAIFFAEKCNAKIFIVNVTEYPYTLSGDPTFTSSATSSAIEKMASFLEDNRDKIPVSFESTTLIGHAAEKIISYADMENIDLIIIGSHGHKMLDKMLFGSVAEKVIKLSPCPVLTINTYRLEEEEGS